MTDRRLKIVEVPSIREPITRSPGFKKKDLADRKLDLMGRCGFSCTYCSSTAGNYQRINRARFADLTEEQLGVRLAPVKIIDVDRHDKKGVLTHKGSGAVLAAEEQNLAFVWPDVIERLEAQLATKRADWLDGEVVVISQLTDAFSGPVLRDGTTRKALDLFVAKTKGRGRILTKNSAIGLSSQWRDYFVAHKDRFVVGLSVGSLDDGWARIVEVGTPAPSARLRATRELQDAGVPTFGMLCPVFPDALPRLDALVDAIRPQRCETVWAEPFNDRANWRHVRAGYAAGSVGWNWFTKVYEHGDKDAWSLYATELYERLVAIARRDGWAQKLKYLLYEGDIAESHARRFDGLEGVLLQGKPDEKTGRSMHPIFAELQATRTP